MHSEGLGKVSATDPGKIAPVKLNNPGPETNGSNTGKVVMQELTRAILCT